MSLARLPKWRQLVNDSARKVHDACGALATAISEGREPRLAPVTLASVPDTVVVDVHAWLLGLANDLTRFSAETTVEAT